MPVGAYPSHPGGEGAANAPSPRRGEGWGGGSALSANAPSAFDNPAATAPVAELFLPAARTRPHRLRDLAMLALALIIIAAAATQLLGQPHQVPAAQGQA